MKESYLFRIDLQYAHLLFKEDEGVNIGNCVKEVIIDSNDPRVPLIKEFNRMLWIERDTFFFYFWMIKRKYTNKELQDSSILHLKIRKRLEMDGSEYGTIYDETAACPICGANRIQMSALHLRKGNWMGKHDIAMTLAGDVIVSKKFKDFVNQNNLYGLSFMPLYTGNTLSEDYFQLSFTEELTVSTQTRFGVDIFGNNHEIVNGVRVCSDTDPAKCPNGDNMGWNILSEIYIKKATIPANADFIVSKQTYGGKGGLFHPYHMYFCSQRAMQLMKENGIKGFDYEVTHLVDE